MKAPVLAEPIGEGTSSESAVAPCVNLSDNPFQDSAAAINAWRETFSDHNLTCIVKTPSLRVKISSINQDPYSSPPLAVLSTHVSATPSYVDGCLSSSPISETGSSPWNKSTPMTPPSTVKMSRETSRKTLESPLAHKASKMHGSVLDIQVGTHIKLEKDSEDVKHHDQRVFRGFSIMLNEKIKEEEIFKEEDGRNYTLNPRFDFAYQTETAIESKIEATVVTDAVTAVVQIPASIAPKKTKQRDRFGELLDQVLPLDLHDRLSSKPRICFASLLSRPNARCGYRAKGMRNAQRLLAKMAGSHQEQDYLSFLAHLKTFLSSALCGIHYNAAMKTTRYGAIEELVEKLVQEMCGAKAQMDSLYPVNTLNETAWVTFLNWVEVICHPINNGKESMLPNKQLVKTPIAKSSTGTTSHPAMAPRLSTTATPPAIPSTLFWHPGFEIWQPKVLQHMPPQKALEKVAQYILNHIESEPGYIYMFWKKGTFGLAKIGYTKIDIPTRLRQWSKKCGHSYQLQKSSIEGEYLDIKIPHAKRVEKLIHTELKDRRLKKQCGCSKTGHREWFNVTEEHAVAVFKKWREWIETGPYEERDGAWNLKESAVDTLEQVCRPVVLEQSLEKSNLAQKNQRFSPSARPKRLGLRVQVKARTTPRK